MAVYNHYIWTGVTMSEWRRKRHYQFKEAESWRHEFLVRRSYYHKLRVYSIFSFVKFWFDVVKAVLIAKEEDSGGCIQKFQDWQPGARTANGTALCH
jgi:hypothetical protein